MSTPAFHKPIIMATWLVAGMGILGNGLRAELPAATVPAPHKTSLEELLKVQQTVQASMAKVRGAVVAIQTMADGDEGDKDSTTAGTASGVIISPDGLILTAKHVAEKPGREVRVVLESGRAVVAVTLGMDETTDAALVQMKDTKKTWPYVAMSRDMVKAQPGEWCFALGHPGGFDKARGVVLRVGKVVRQTANSLQTDCVLMGGDSGGPLFDLEGEVIGIHSQIWEGRDENMHVSMAPFLRSWEDMKTSRIVRVWGTGSGGFLGVATGLGQTGKLEVMDVIGGSPAERAGLHVGDIIMMLNGETIADQPQFSNAVRGRAAGDEVTLRIRTGEAEREVPVKLGVKPKEDEG